MKKCPRCGKEYSNEMTACPQDGESLVNHPMSPAGKLGLASMVLGLLLVLEIISVPLGMAFFSFDTAQLLFSTAIVCGPFIGIAAIISGHFARARKRKNPLRYGDRGSFVGLITGYTGTLLIITILGVAFLTPARSPSPSMACLSNLKQVYLAASLWSDDHNGILPKSFLDMTNELANPRLLICPTDPKHKLPQSGSPIVWNPTNITYEFLTPATATNKIQNVVVFRCPIHGFEVLGDGTVRDGK